MLNQLFENACLDTIFLTPNRRLAAYLRQEYNLMQQNNDKHTWPEINIMPITTWLEKTWQDHIANKVILNNHQEYVLWHNIITKFSKKHKLLHSTALIAQAQQAYNLIQQWQINLANPDFTITEDTQALRSWAYEFTQQLENNNWLTHNDIANELNFYLTRNALPLPKTLIMVGFDIITPQLKTLLQQLQTHKCQIEYFDPNIKKGKATRTSCSNPEEELISMALWAHKCAVGNPAAHIGCIVPELTAVRSQVEYIFNKINPSNFDISIGISLDQYPLIASALQILETNRVTSKSTQKAEAWVKTYLTILQAENWQGLEPENTHEIKLLERWHKLLNEFTSLDMVTTNLSSYAAIQQLSTLATNTIFQPAASPKAQIQILGTLEAAGLNFTHLWVMNLNDKNWPPAPQLNPFIPAQLQRKLAMPHASPEHELELCQILTQRFARSADQVVYSYAMMQQDQMQNASPLIQHIPEINLRDLELPEFELYETTPTTLEQIADTEAPAIETAMVIKGGSSIFQLQAACPFRAFSQCRLHAKSPDTPQLGLDAKERGILVHAMLEYAWEKIKNHKHLIAYTSAELTKVIKASVAKSLTLISKPEFVKIEQPRLEKLLSDWLEFEKKRIPFTVIAQEKWQKITVGKLQNINVRIDRIDKLEDGSYIIIDYKTGKVTATGWDGERPDAPQLPLYCISSPDSSHGLIYAQVKNGDFKFKGLTKSPEQIPGVKAAPNWQQLVQEWRHTLEQLSTAFCNGKAEVDPKDGSKTCRTCKLQPLCRIYEYDS